MVGLSSISGVALAFLAAIISGIHARMFEGTAAGSALKVEHSEIARRFDYRLSVKKPFFFHNDPDMLPYYETSGHVLKSPDQLRLTSSLPNQRGAVWSKSSNPHKEWQIHFSFNVFGRAITGGEGLAIWYAKDKSVEGPVYGSMDKWHGVGIFLDTADANESRNTPYIYAVVNDGSHSFNPNEYLANSIGGCFRDYRNAPHPVWGRLTYANRTLRLDMDLRQDGYAFTFCFEKSGIDLPVGYHFGMSASTSEHHYDDHDMLSLEVFEVNPPPKAGATIEGVLSEETRKKIEQAEREVRAFRDAASADDGSQPETMSPHVLQQVLENQFKMIEALNILYDRVGEEPIAAADATHEKTRQSVHQAVSPLHQRLSDLNARLDDLNTKIEENIRLRELAAKLQTVSEDLHGLFGRIKAMNEKGDHALRQVAASLESSKSKLEETHEVIKQTAGSSHYLFYVIFFVAGGILAYAGSVVYRMNSAPKKYI